MLLLTELDFSLPLKNPVIIFSLVLFIILFAPILFNKIRVPHIIGLIIAGVLIGPYGLNLLLRDSSIVLFGTVGLIYIMFTAGLEIDIEEFKKNRFKSLVFGLFTFAVPMVLGTFLAYYLLAFSFPSALLLSSMFASHTLLAYPIASKYGLSRIRSVTMSIGATIITDILALLVLAGVTGMTQGNIGTDFWLRLAISSAIFGGIVFFGFPLVARYFFKRFDDHISQYIFVLAMVFLGSFLAEVAGLEAIIGAFLSGLALNRFIPHVSPLMNRIEFVGNAFFIPFFLISVGMLVDVSVLFKGTGALKVAGFMIVLAIVTKYIAAWATQKTFRMSAPERQMIFGLSTARVGATLAVVLVGYNIIIGETAAGDPIRLLDEDILNGTILMILVTCTVSPFLVEKASRKLALQEGKESPGSEAGDDRILVSLAYPETVAELIDLGLMLRSGQNSHPVFALHVTDDERSKSNAISGKKIMDMAARHAAATGQAITPLLRYDVNISNGIIYSIKEQNITDALIGLHQDGGDHSFLGIKAEQLLSRIHETVYIYRPGQPFNTLKRMIVAVPPQAEAEPGFVHWVRKLMHIMRSAGMPVHYYANKTTIHELQQILSGGTIPANASYNEFPDWEDFLAFSGILKPNDLFVIVSSRKDQPSSNPQMDRLPSYLGNYFSDYSFLLIYPRQLEQGINMGDLQQPDRALADTLSGKLGGIGKAADYLQRLFGGRK
jgi:Kef-type K+ transport system membrane component KefB